MQCTWATKLKEELELCEAPVLAKLKGSLDPDRAILALAGKTRARYVTTYSRWRLKDGSPPGLPADLADYIMARGDEPCGRTVPEAILKAVCWIESCRYPGYLGEDSLGY